MIYDYISFISFCVVLIYSQADCIPFTQSDCVILSNVLSKNRLNIKKAIEPNKNNFMSLINLVLFSLSQLVKAY